ncbi:MAG: MFS transporter [Clostridia bacterium]|nr:MFS transporter [Clostridia bacterium]
MKPLGIREKVGYALGDFASCLIWQTISVYLLFYFTDVAGVEEGAAITIIFFSKMIDGITDIVMGFIIERTHTRFGKVRPYLLTMGLPLAVSAVLLFSVPDTLSATGKLVWIFVAYNLTTSVCYTGLNVPYSSMHNFLTDDSMERSRLAVIRLIFAYSALVFINTAMFSLVQGLGDGTKTCQAGWTNAMVILGTAAFGLALVTFFSTKERVGSSNASGTQQPRISEALRSIGRNRYLLIVLAATLCTFVSNVLFGSSSVYYAKFILHNTDATSAITNATTIAMVLGLVFIVPWLLKRFPKRLIYQTGILLMSLAFFMSRLVTDNLPVLMGLNVIKGLALGATSSMMYAMCADAIDWGEYRSGIRTAGLGTAMLQCMGKFGMGLGTGLMGLVFAAGGFVAGSEVQEAGGLNALISVYTWIPGIVLLASFGIMFAYDLDKKYPEVAKALRERRENAVIEEK